MYDELRDQLIRHEGLKLKPYLCTSNKVTIGVGRNLEDVGLSKQEALYLLDNDIVRVVAESRERFPIVETLDPVRADVIFNMVFNMGVHRVALFKNMWAAIEAQDWNKAAEEMLDSKWAYQVGRRSTELANQMRTGQYNG
jgi:lysozyme